MMFAVTLSQAWPEDVRFSYSTARGPAGSPANTLAQPGLDFTSSQGQLTIPAGSLRAQIAVPILSDQEVELNETFTVAISGVRGTDNQGNFVGLGRAQATGTIIEAIKGVTFAGQVDNYIVSTAGINSRARAVPFSYVSLFVEGTNFSRSVTTDSHGNFSLSLRPGTYSVQLDNFLELDALGTPQFYSLPARTVTVTGNSSGNLFAFYGAVGTITIPSSPDPLFQGAATIQVEARPVGADPDSVPISITQATFPSQLVTPPAPAPTPAPTTPPTKAAPKLPPPRTVRFFLPALPPGAYTLSLTDAGTGEDATSYLGAYSFPTVNVSLPDTRSINNPDAHVTFFGKLTFDSAPSANHS